MKVTFFYNEVESLGVQYLSRALREAGHETSLLFDPKLFDFFRQEYNVRPLARLFSFDKEIGERLLRHRPDVVGFSVLTANSEWATGWARFVKQHLPGTTVVAGGYHATANTASLLRTGVFDYVVRGEGEDSLVELVDSLERGEVDRSIPNLAYLDGDRYVENPLRPYENDLDRFGPPDKELFWGLGSPFTVGHMTEWHRGCPWGCTFCGNNYYRKIYYPGRDDYMFTREFLRGRSVDDVLAELREIKARYNPRIMRVNDDDLCADEAWLLELADRMTDAERIPFKCFAIPNNINERTIVALKKIGCAQIQMGVQSLNPKIRKLIGRPNSNKQIAQAIDLAREHHIGLYVDQIFGLPGETEDDLVEVEQFYAEHPPCCVSVYWLDLWGGVDILQQAVDAGTITQETADAIKGSMEVGDISTIRRYHNDFAKPYAWRIETRNSFGPRTAGFLVKTGLYKLVAKTGFFRVVRTVKALRYVNHLHAFPPARAAYDISWARFPRLVWSYGWLRVGLWLGLRKEMPMVVLPPLQPQAGHRLPATDDVTTARQRSEAEALTPTR